ncbi:MAG: hypothetical protein KBT03_02375 [Bacteroidales bacterium]|nr:hypothetical protein [Candidatus Scybalousia scybalohippi]
MKEENDEKLYKASDVALRLGITEYKKGKIYPRYVRMNKILNKKITKKDFLTKNEVELLENAVGKNLDI